MKDPKAFGSTRQLIEKYLLEAEAKYSAGDYISSRGQSEKDQKFLKRDIERHLKEGLTKMGDELGLTLRGLKMRDAQGFQILENNLHSLDINYLQAIMEGRFNEWTDRGGKKIRAYHGGAIGRGGMGAVSHVLYTVDGSPGARRAVIKTTFDTSREIFRNEGQKGEVVQRDLNSKYINQPLHIGDNFIILETGPNPRTLQEEFSHSTPREVIKMFRDVIKGLKIYQSKGYIPKTYW
jgi:hypothetical protein